MCFTHALQQPQFGSLYTVMAVGTPGGSLGASLDASRAWAETVFAAAVFTATSAVPTVPTTSAERNARRLRGCDSEG